MATITMETDWGAKGAQLTGAQVQAFIKEQLTANSDRIDAVSDSMASVKRDVIDLDSARTPMCYVLYTNLYDCYICTAKSWRESERHGEDNVPQGVLVLPDGRRPIIVGLRQAVLPWCKDADVQPVNAMTRISEESYGALNRAELNTLVNSNVQAYFGVPNPQGCLDYAPTYCWNHSSLYDGSDANMHGIAGMGDWDLPTLGTLKEVDKYMDAINDCLGSVGGDMIEQGTRYWSINERNAAEAWTMSMNKGGGSPVSYDKKTGRYHVLPVTVLPEHITIETDI